MSLFDPFSFLSKAQNKDLLHEFNIRDVKNGIVFLNDGRLEVGLSINLPSALSAPLTSDFMNNMGAALLSTPEGSRIRFTLMIGESDTTFIEEYKRLVTEPHEAARIFANGRYEYYRHLWKHGYVVKWQAYISVVIGKKSRRKTHAYTPVLIDKAKRIRQRLKVSLQRLGYKPNFLTTQEIFRICFNYFNPSSNKVSLGTYKSTYQVYPKKKMEENNALRPPTFVAQIAKSSVDNTNLSHLKVGNHYIKIISLNTIPDETFYGMGNYLIQPGLKQTIVIDFHHIPQDQALLKIKNRNAKAYATVAAGGNVDADVAEGLSQGRELVRHIMQTNDHTFRVSCAIILMDENLEELTDITTSVQSSLTSIPGNPFRLVDSGVFQPWMQFSPFSGQQYGDSIELVQTNALHFLPVSGTWSGSRKPVSLFHTRSGAIVSIDPFSSDKSNPHTLCLGRTRSGKTFLLQYLASEALKDKDISLIVIDRGLGWENLVEVFDGVVVKVEPGGATSINPFDLPFGEITPSETKRSLLINVLSAMCETDKSSTKADEIAIFTSAIQQVYQAHTDEIEGDEGTFHKILEPFTLTDFVDTLLTLSSIGNRPVTDADMEIAHTLARRLQVWTGDSSLGKFLDRPTSFPMDDSKVILYETSAFNDMPALSAVGTMLIQAQIWQHAEKSPDKRVILAIDEAEKIIADPNSRALTMDIARRGAKKGLALWLLTHSVLDIVGEGKEALANSFANFFLVRLTGEDDALQEYLNIPSDALEAFKTLTYIKGEYNEVLYVSNSDELPQPDCEVLVLRPSLFDYWMLTTDINDRAIIAQKEKELGSREAAIRSLAETGATP